MHVFLALWYFDYPMHVLFSYTLCTMENAFISGQGFAVALPSRSWRCTVETRVCAWHKSPSIWAERKQRWPQALRTGKLIPRPAPSFPFIYFTFPLLFHSLYSKSSREAMNKVKGAFAYITHGTFFVREITLACFYFSTSLRSNSICIFWLKRLLPYNILPGCPYSSNLYY